MQFTVLILVLPLVAFLVLGLGGKWMRPRAAGLTGTLTMAVTTLTAWATAWLYFFAPAAGGALSAAGASAAANASGLVGTAASSAPAWMSQIPLSTVWLSFSERLHIDLGVLLDPISVMMLVVITTVSLMVHIYSMGYMKGETGFQRYYAFLSLFSFSMLGLVVATNIFQMYIFWELVGVSSYLLIGFYYTKPSAVAASKKAFIVTRFADLGFLIGILVLSYYTGTFDLGALTANHGQLVISSMSGASFLGLSVATWAMALIFMGGAGKSAMFPLHIWLPDAMEGPTPVSALIHAATMVVAGVYLVARLFPVYFFAAPDVLRMIGYVGAFTALFAAIIAITQTDIKRVLAFSTISQIAFMMVALGVSGFGGHDGLGYTQSMFHLFTHAFFKALLFLGAGAVIHAVHSNDMREMGGLHRYLPVTSITFLIACLAISGIPPFSGFFSKDEILAAAFHGDKVLFGTLLLVSGFTAFYMFRLYYSVFRGTDRHYHHTPEEHSWAMRAPLIFLAALTCTVGFIPMAHFISSDGVPYSTHIEWEIAVAGVGVALCGILLARALYRRPSAAPERLAGRMGWFYRAALNKFYMDELWMWMTKSVIFRYISMPIAWFDRHVIDGTMNLIGLGTVRSAEGIKGLQSGKVQTYAVVFVVGSLIIAVLALYFFNY